MDNFKNISIQSNENSDKEYKVIKNNKKHMDTKPDIFSSLVNKDKTNDKKQCNIGLDLLVNQQKNRNRSSESNSMENKVDEDFIMDAIEEQKINNSDKMEEDDKFSFKSYTSNQNKNNIQTFKITRDLNRNNNSSSGSNRSINFNRKSNKDEPNLISQEELDKISEIVVSKDEDITMEIKNKDKRDIYNNSSYSTKNFHEIKKEKEELLFKFEKMRRLGLKLPRTFNMSSDIEEMKMEYEKLRKSREVENGIKFSRKMLIACTTGLEFVNSKFDPFDIKLDGWSESIHENISEYDEVFEELYEKYKTDTPVAPELKLLMMVGGSALMFHLTNTMFKSSLPGMGDMLKNNPELMKKFAKVAMDGVTKETKEEDELDNIPMPSNGTGQREMKGPTNVDDLLRELESEESSINETNNESKNVSFPFLG